MAAPVVSSVRLILSGVLTTVMSAVPVAPATLTATWVDPLSLLAVKRPSVVTRPLPFCTE